MRDNKKIKDKKIKKKSKKSASSQKKIDLYPEYLDLLNRFDYLFKSCSQNNE